MKMRQRKKRLVLLLICSLLFELLSIHRTTYKSIAASELALKASVTASSLRVRTQAGTNKPQLVVKGKSVSLPRGQIVTILGEKKAKGQKWYFISFSYNKTTKKGYVLSDYIELNFSTNIKGKISKAGGIKISKKAGSTTSFIKKKKTAITLKKNKAVTLLSEITTSGKKWFEVLVTYEGKQYNGYIEALYIKLQPKANIQKPQPTQEPNSTDSPNEVYTTKTIGKAIVDNLNVRIGAGTSYKVVTINNINIKLKKGQEVTVLEEVQTQGEVWYSISFMKEETEVTGYVKGEYLEIETVQVVETPKPSKTPKPSQTPKPSEEPEETPTPTPVPSQEPTPTPAIPISDAEFEQMLTKENFPESYKSALRTLHDSHPYWKFQAYHTNLDWNTVIEEESIVGKNLIPNSKDVAWKSTESGAYNWSTGKFVVYDGTSWVTASREAISYYMDPRNFLTQKGIYQFELLSYQNEYQTKLGVESILISTPMYNTSYSYIDPDTNQSATKSYSDTFLKAAEYSGVSPYHLATRCKQEVISNKAFSGSASGTYSGYEGYYNFYNIGASDSAGGGAVAKGLSFAKNGTTSAASNKLFLIPWTSPYRAIVGGAKYIGNNYINRGQNTLYLQKFNVTENSTYNHQYMSNVEAANSEAIKTYGAYSTLEELPITFSIPVYNNMPDTPCPEPSEKESPNNWLKTLQVEGYTLTPTFQTTNTEETTYSLIVDKSVSQVTITAAPVESSAAVAGTGTITLMDGMNNITVTVTAQNGSTRNYYIQIIRN